jgi:hypothetical protein
MNNWLYEAERKMAVLAQWGGTVLLQGDQGASLCRESIIKSY